MITYLYVKTHTITGLKYLGKTIEKDPHKYKGSGTYWRSHLKKHGATYTTEILKECEHPAMVEFWGQHYSNLWNIVESDEWANLKPETGEGGSSRGIKRSPESIAKRLATMKLNGTAGNANSPTAIAKRNDTLRSLGGYKHSPETIAKMLDARRTNGTVNTQKPDSTAKRLATRAANKAANKLP